MGNTKHNHLIWSGLLLIGAALFLLTWSIREEQRASHTAQQVLETLSKRSIELQFPEPIADLPEPIPEMPTNTVNGVAYLGTLEIPSLGLDLPVISQLSNRLLQLAPCRYQGSIYQDNMILAAHNYRAHFGRLKELVVGDELSFTDAEGNCIPYTVSAMETLDGTAVAQMEEGEWDLTLFTCTIGGRSRVTVRCVRAED